MKICPSCKHCFASEDWICSNCQYTPPQRNGFLAFATEQADSSDGFEASFFEQLSGVETGHFWFEARNQLILWCLRRYFANVLASGNFLEVGCGTAFVLSAVHRAFPSMHLMGSEVFVEGLTYAQKRLPDVTFFQMDARHIPYANEFDVIGAFDVLEHIAEDGLVLTQLNQAIKPGGGLLLTVPQHRFLWSIVDEYSHHCRRYTQTDLFDKMRHSGFNIVRATSFNTLLLPLITMSRLFQNRHTETYDPLSEFKISPILNATLTKVLDFERLIIQGGISLPLGSSLLIVARKP